MPLFGISPLTWPALEMRDIAFLILAVDAHRAERARREREGH